MKKVSADLARIFFGILMLLAASGAARADDAPQWLRSAAAAQVPKYDKDVPAVVLYEEEQVTLGSDGKLLTTDNFAVRILNRDGRGYALARAEYLVSASKV